MLRSRPKNHLVLVTVGLVQLIGCQGENGNEQLDVREKLQPQIVAPVGVAECDEYLALYERCIDSNFPFAQSSPALSGLTKTRNQWATMADTTFKKSSLGRMCSAAIRSAAVELVAYGCSWSATNPTGSGGAGTGTGGSSSGGAASGGAPSGGSSSGGAASGGAASGGAASGGSSSGGSSACTISSATEIGPPSTVKTVSNKACLKVQTGYPSWWGTRNMQLQVQDGGAYPAPFSWSNTCAPSSGTASFTANWQSLVIGPTKSSCATLISFSGSGSGTLKIIYY